MRLPADAHPNNWLNANCSSQLQAMNSEKGHSFARHRFNSVCGRSSTGRFANSVARSGDLLSSVLRRTGSRQEIRVSWMGEIIASLDGYFCLPGHNFDWKHAGVSRAIPQRARSHGMEAKEFGKILMRWQGQSLHAWPKICGAVACHYSLTFGAVSSVVERLVYTERVGGSNPSPPSLHFGFSIRELRFRAHESI